MNQFTLGSERRNLRSFAAVIVGALLAIAPASSEPIKKSGYAIGADICGSGELAFPRVQIDMKAGFCAGLVASEEDRLKFPRSIVQVPGRDLFVVADMGGWGHTDGRLLLLDPHAPQGQRFKELLTGIEYPFGLVIGPEEALRLERGDDLPLRSAGGESAQLGRDHHPSHARPNDQAA